MASGLPIIGNDAGQIKFILEENKNGLLTNGSIDDIAEKIIYLKNNKTIASEMGVRSREAIDEKYNWKSRYRNRESSGWANSRKEN